MDFFKKSQGGKVEVSAEKKAPQHVVEKLSALKGEARWEPYDGCTAAAWVGYQFTERPSIDTIDKI